MIVYIDVLMLS